MPVRKSHLSVGEIIERDDGTRVIAIIILAVRSFGSGVSKSLVGHGQRPP